MGQGMYLLKFRSNVDEDGLIAFSGWLESDFLALCWIFSICPALTGECFVHKERYSHD